MKNYFKLEEAMSSPHKFIIQPNHDLIDKFFKPPFQGSFGLLPARLVNLSYAQYCRFCRDILGAELIGKNCSYLHIYFQKTQEVQMFIRLLNKRMEYLEHEFDHPYDYEEKNGIVSEIPWRVD